MEPTPILPSPPTPILEARIVELLRRGEPLVLMTLVASHGSTPRHTGTRALVTRNGCEGTIGGGILEAQAIALAQACLTKNISKRQTFSLDNSTQESDMICGGQIDVLCEVLRPSEVSLFAEAVHALEEGVRGFWQVRLSPEGTFERSLCLEGSPAWDAQLYATMKGRPGHTNDLYVEPLSAKPLLLLCGGGHVSLAVAHLAYACDFIVDVVDDRDTFANPTRFPMARHTYVLPGFRDLCTACALVPGQYVAILTRGHAYDQDVLEQILTFGRCFYVGMIGSKTKRATVYAALREKGFSEESLARVKCPIGLGIRAETPQQIAVAIVGELLAAKGGVLDALRPK